MTMLTPRNGFSGDIETFLVQTLIERFGPNHEWDTERVYLNRVPDLNGFMPANILLVLQHCFIQNQALNDHIEKAKHRLLAYRKGHLAYYWPFNDGRSTIPNAPTLSKFEFLTLSPDADDTTVQQLVLHETQFFEPILNELAFYRCDEINFIPPNPQRILGNWNGAYLAWFPERERCSLGKIETLDLGVSANILWFLSRFGFTNHEGAQETAGWIKHILKNEFILSHPFFLTRYYPVPLLQLYILARAVDLGQLVKAGFFSDEDIEMMKRLFKKMVPRSRYESLLTLATAIHLNDRETFSKLRHILQSPILDSGIYFAAPLVPIVTYQNPIFAFLAKQPFMRFRFESIALSAAIHLWCLQAAKQRF
ncbi:MAG: hypothetical protein SFU91_04170 [Chloroherpetonaceae bacterium]|nr:hypothetical protein [Chloroherpetonaceae bacterium]